MQPLEYEILPAEEGAQVKTVLRNRGLSTGLIRRLKQTGGIFLENRSVTVAQPVRAGQRLSLVLPGTPSEYVKPVPMSLSVVYEDDWLLIVDKPSGIPVHPSAGHHDDSLAGGVAYYMKDKDFVFRPITRLDRYTAGLVLIAKNSIAAADLCGQIQKGTIEKTYYAVTAGIPHPMKGEINQPIAREENSVIKRKVCETGKPALTKYQVEQTKGNLALVRVVPVTGRTHQIRVHLAYLGCPLLYDFLYGEEQENQMFLLQCTGLSFVHPHTGEKIVLEIPCVIWM